jgi:hypothetical protein
LKKDKKNISLWIKKIILVALDIVAINAATVLSLFVRFELSFSKIDVQYIENARQFRIGFGIENHLELVFL